MKGLLLLAPLVVAGCAGGERWINAQSEEVNVEGIPYSVLWTHTGATVETRVLRNQALVVMPDALTEKRRSLEAGARVASRICGGPATQTAELKDGGFWAASFVCKGAS
jgi:hypothetical protein